MSGASMWLDALATRGAAISSPAAVASCSSRRPYVISNLVKTGVLRHPAEQLELRGQEGEAKRASLPRPTRGVGGAALSGGDGRRVDEQPSILRAFGQGPGHDRGRFVEASCRRQRPGQ